MRKTLSFIAIFMVGWLTGCNRGKETPPETPLVHADTSKLKAQDIVTLPISLQNTAEMVASMLKQKALGNIAKNASLGGYFMSDVFRVQPPNRGVLLWHCYNPRGENSLPKFFVAVEQVTGYDSIKKPPTEPAAMDLAVPLGTYKYTPSDNSQLAVLNSIRAQRTKPSAPGPSTTFISRVLVKRYNLKFDSLMLSIKKETDSLYCKYPHAFFIDNTAYENFLRRNPTYVRYYFGVSWDKKHEPNYLRPILGGANADGYTIQKKSLIVNDEPFIQKSVPPPPIE